MIGSPEHSARWRNKCSLYHFQLQFVESSVTRTLAYKKLCLNSSLSRASSLPCCFEHFRSSEQHRIDTFLRVRVYRVCEFCFSRIWQSLCPFLRGESPSSPSYPASHILVSRTNPITPPQISIPNPFPNSNQTHSPSVPCPTDTTPPLRAHILPHTPRRTRTPRRAHARENETSTPRRRSCYRVNPCWVSTRKPRLQESVPE